MRLSVISLFCLASQVWCAPVLADALPADQLVRETATQTLEEIRRRSDEFDKEPAQLHALVEARLVPRFDMPMIARQVLGRHWSQANPEQRARFASAFQRMLVRTYSSALLAFKDDVIEWQPPSQESGDDVTVKSTIKRSNGQALNIHYRMHKIEDDWLVHDVSIDGISFVTNYRGVFNSEIRKHNLEMIIERLERKSSS
jgi:phospholipid transport system substrate-binding protein